ncbi:MAG: transaldolase [Chloroflexi bacterium]|nr:transaldolase [Chloroflexota bacterium]
MAPGFLRLEALDTTDPDAIRALEGRLDVAHTLFIVASKSGTTTEPLAFMEYFWSKAPNGRQFVVITDPGTPLERTAAERGFRRVFPHPPDVGGRYAALTAIGMLPAACLGVDIELLLGRAHEMAERCRSTGVDNPGVAFGSEMGQPARDEGRDKLTIVCSPGIGTFGYWALRLTNEPDAEQDRAVTALEQAGFPVGRIELRDRYDLGGQFFLWEFAVPVASTFIGVEPFDQPNVQESKDNTNRLLRVYIETGALPEDPLVLADGGISISARGRAAGAVQGAANLTDALRAYLRLIRSGDYLAFTAYVPPGDEAGRRLRDMRTAVRDNRHVATTVGYGPRFLHSTGQLHKGGGDSGVFIQITCDPTEDLPVPGQPYTFGVLKAAQALGDLQSLQSRDRRALRVHLGADVQGGLRRLEESIRAALEA